MENIIEGTKDNVSTLIAEDKYTILDFHAAWCGPCLTLGPILDKLAEENPKIQVVKIDVDANTDLSVEYKIRSIPTVFIYKKGELTDKFIGVKMKDEILKLITE